MTYTVKAGDTLYGISNQFGVSVTELAKTRASLDFGSPLDAVTPQKIRRIVNSADAYLRLNCIDMDVRFDIVSIVADGGEFRIEHIEDAFFPPVE